MAKIFAGADWKHPDTFAVWYEDRNGEEVLARCKDFKEAQQRASYFNGLYKKGISITPDASVELLARG